MNRTSLGRFGLVSFFLGVAATLALILGYGGSPLQRISLGVVSLGLLTLAFFGIGAYRALDPNRAQCGRGLARPSLIPGKSTAVVIFERGRGGAGVLRTLKLDLGEGETQVGIRAGARAEREVTPGGKLLTARLAGAVAQRSLVLDPGTVTWLRVTAEPGSMSRKNVEHWADIRIEKVMPEG